MTIQITTEKPPKTIIEKFDQTTICKVLNHEIPNLPINTITIIETGWDHLVAEVNQDLIFRFPRTESSIANLEREKRLLNYLKQYISLPIPNFHYVGTATAFVGYHKLEGTHLSQQIYQNLDYEARQQIAQTFATFFTELHHAVTKEQALSWGYDHVIRPLHEITTTLVPILPKNIAIMVQEAIAQAYHDLSNEQNLVFLHQDVNGDNSTFNATTLQITGIFDFSDVGIAPYSWEFAELFVIDAELAKLTADIYTQQNSVPSPLIGGAADYILRKATVMLYALQNGDEQKVNNLLQDLSDFMPIWREVVRTTLIK